MKPINPPLPLFFAPCVKCGHQGNSLSMAAAEAPFTYACWACQDDATREEVRLATNAFIVQTSRTEPGRVAHARRMLDIKRPPRTPYDASWEGCGVQQ